MKEKNSFSYFIIMNCVHFSCSRFFYLFIIHSIYTYFKAWSVSHTELLAIEIIACLILSYKKNNLEHIFRSLLYIYDLSALSYLTIYLNKVRPLDGVELLAFKWDVFFHFHMIYKLQRIFMPNYFEELVLNYNSINRDWCQLTNSFYFNFFYLKL